MLKVLVSQLEQAEFYENSPIYYFQTKKLGRNFTWDRVVLRTKSLCGAIFSVEKIAFGPFFLAQTLHLHQIWAVSFKKIGAQLDIGPGNVLLGHFFVQKALFRAVFHGPNPKGRRGGPGLSAMSRGWGQCPRAQNSCLEQFDCSEITSKIKREPTQSNSRSLRVSK